MTDEDLNEFEWIGLERDMEPIDAKLVGERAASDPQAEDMDHDRRGTGKSDRIHLNTTLRSSFRRHPREYGRDGRQGKPLLSMIGYQN
jgi:hypothetical protein